MNTNRIIEKAKLLFNEEHSTMRLDGWFIIKEIERQCDSDFAGMTQELKKAHTLVRVAEALPLRLSENAIFAGSQSDAFARSYALINPSFTVESFCGYCDPTAVFDDIEPNGEFTKERIKALRDYNEATPYVRDLSAVYDGVTDYTKEVCFFIEQVTGHVIPDIRPILKCGIGAIISELEAKASAEEDAVRRDNFTAMAVALSAARVLARRYGELAKTQLETADDQRRAELEKLIATLERVPENGASTLYEAIQSFMLIWQLMCIEQAPNPFAFSVGNADRIFEPYRAMENCSRDTAAAYFRHFLVFFNVGDRSWAISQNIIISGMDTKGNDLTNECSYALMDAYYDMNLPQPILSVKLHKNTPNELYRAMGRFFFTPGTLTPSLFNDDAMFAVLKRAGVDEADIPDYSIAGCQEPLIMGKDNGNTTSSWFNLGKILELTITDGISEITGERLAEPTGLSAKERLERLEDLFYANAEFYADKMTEAANGAAKALSHLRVPLLSTLMGGIESGYDMRDPEHQGTKYNGNGCLIHGLSVVADSFIAVKHYINENPDGADRLVSALMTDFKDDEPLRQLLATYPKFGNNISEVDEKASEIADKIADLIASKKNYLGNAFRPDYSTPSTHLLYGYWVGATPDGRHSRDMLNYGVDPLYGDAQNGLGFRMLSAFKLPYEKMNGGYASHFGVDPKYFTGATYEEKGEQFASRVIAPLFFNSSNKDTVSPFYLYVNVTTADMLRKVLANPKKYAPSGVYIMRIHGTFVNFLDLSPAIQKDIITRLDPSSTQM
ncbi:MAG: hypothetical protein E7491_00525 [Ruminococcaceae bacterium]|nr:hypothetical protein [Oscillospiraceae bacterium]